MIRRLPIVPTIIVLLLVGVMIRLGFWQIQRAHERDALLASYARNVSLPAVSFPATPVGDTLLFRRASGFCLKPTGFHPLGAGAQGFRIVARCQTGAEGPGLTVQLGTTRNPDQQVRWAGGPVTGFIDYAPDERPMTTRMFNRQPRTLMLVAVPPLAGLAANPSADPSAQGNSSWAYAFQWFAFAAVALIIYAFAIRARLRRQHA